VTDVDICANDMYDQVMYASDTMISVLHASPYLDSFAIVNIHLLNVDSTVQYFNVESGTSVNNTLITADTTIFEDYTNFLGCDSILVKNYLVENPNAVSLVNKDYWDVFPNPTKGSLTITTNQSFTNDIYKMSVINIIGQTVYHQDHRITPNKTVSLDLKNLSAGTYLLNISSKHGMITEKIVINP